jgi:hypothetical protein
MLIIISKQLKDAGFFGWNGARGAETFGIMGKNG